MRKIFVVLFLALSAGASPFLDLYLERGMEGVLADCAKKSHLDNFYDAAALHGLDPRGEHPEITKLLEPHQDILRYVNVDPMIKAFQKLDKEITKGKKIREDDFNSLSITQNPDYYGSLVPWVSYLKCALLTKMSTIQQYENLSKKLFPSVFQEAVHFPLSMLHPQYLERLGKHKTDYLTHYQLEKKLWKEERSPSQNFSSLATMWFAQIEKKMASDRILAGILSSRRSILCLLSPMDFKVEEASPAVLLETALNLSFKGKPGEALLGLVKFFTINQEDPNAKKTIEMLTRASQLTDAGTFSTCMENIFEARIQTLAEALFVFGKFFHDKKYPQWREIIAFFEAAGELDHSESLFAMGNLFQEDLPGIPKNLEKAFVCYEKSAKLGWAKAQNNVGIFYQKGYGTGIDMEKARFWYEAAVAQSFPDSFPNLIWIYEESKELEKWRECLIKGAEAGQKTSQFSLGAAYFKGKVDKDGNVILPMDKKEAFSWYQKSAAQNYGMALQHLGLCYHLGNGVKQDFSKALSFYEKAVAGGHTGAKVNLGLLYFHGQRVDKNLEKAVQLWEEVGDQEPTALYNLGLSYENGMGVRKDSKRAEALYEQAAKMGEDNAKIALSALRMKGSKSKKTSQEAYSLVAEAVANKAIPSTQVGEQIMVTLPDDIMQETRGKAHTVEEESSEEDAEASADISPVVARELERQPSSDPELQAIFDAIAEEEEQWAQDRKKKNKVRGVFKNPTTETEAFQPTRSLLETAQAEGIAYFKAFYDPTAAEGLDRNDLAKALGQLGCEIQGLPSGAGFMASYKMNSSLLIVWTCHNKHKTTRSSLGKGGLRRDLKTFLTKIGASEEEIMER